MKKAGLLAIGMFLAATARAEDVWVLQGAATGYMSPALSYLWTSDTLFHNNLITPATVRLVDISNGPVLTADREFTLAAGRSTSANREGKAWRPNPPTGNIPLWVAHLDVPSGVIVESRVSVGIQPNLTGTPAAGVYGKLSFPVFRALQPAGVTKIHLGTDLEAVPARNNVAVYNSGNASAHARIEVHQVCDESLIDSRVFEIPPNTLIQVTGLSTATTGCFNAGNNYTYVAVTVDQPSLSWVSSLSNTDLIKVVWAATSSSP